jgi:hypothetical protein
LRSPFCYFSHLSRGLATGPLPWNFPYNTSFSILELFIRTIWPANFILLNFKIYHCIRSKNS